ncbi:hypothetical protein K1719_003821 [Acacia pycnantha]|nr:hypothetical protein K1719_003821 [Acacia pycnantha]
MLMLHLEEAWAVGNNASVKCIEKERLSLLSLKQSFVDHNNNLSSWGRGESQEECCNWKGVSCDNLTGHVVELDISFYGLEGLLPSFSQLSSLTTLWLEHNQLNGTLNDSIGLLTNLKKLSIKYNSLEGEIPSELMDLVGLVALNISRNMISGQIPTAIGQLKLLDFLDLSRNHLFGRIPSQLSQIDRLSVMDLSYNNLFGEIPIGTQLQSFDPSAYVGNERLCGDPLPKCPKPKKPTVENKDDDLFFSRGGRITELQLRSSCMEELSCLICFVERRLN